MKQQITVLNNLFLKVKTEYCFSFFELANHWGILEILLNQWKVYFYIAKKLVILGQKDTISLFTSFTFNQFKY